MSRAGLPDPVLARVLVEVVRDPGRTARNIDDVVEYGRDRLLAVLVRLADLGYVRRPGRSRQRGYRPTEAGHRAIRRWQARREPLVGVVPRVRTRPGELRASVCERCDGDAPPDVPVCRACEEEP